MSACMHLYMSNWSVCLNEICNKGASRHVANHWFLLRTLINLFNSYNSKMCVYKLEIFQRNHVAGS